MKGTWQRLSPGADLCRNSCKVDERMGKKGMLAGSSVPPDSLCLTQLFLSSPTEKEASKFLSSRNGCGQVLVVFAL